MSSPTTHAVARSRTASRRTTPARTLSAPDSSCSRLARVSILASAAPAGPSVSRYGDAVLGHALRPHHAVHHGCQRSDGLLGCRPRRLEQHRRGLYRNGALRLVRRPVGATGRLHFPRQRLRHSRLHGESGDGEPTGQTITATDTLDATVTGKSSAVRGLTHCRGVAQPRRRWRSHRVATHRDRSGLRRLRQRHEPLQRRHPPRAPTPPWSYRLRRGDGQRRGHRDGNADDDGGPDPHRHRVGDPSIPVPPKPSSAPPGQPSGSSKRRFQPRRRESPSRLP